MAEILSMRRSVASNRRTWAPTTTRLRRRNSSSSERHSCGAGTLTKSTRLFISAVPCAERVAMSQSHKHEAVAMAKYLHVLKHTHACELFDSIHNHLATCRYAWGNDSLFAADRQGVRIFHVPTQSFSNILHSLLLSQLA